MRSSIKMLASQESSSTGPLSPLDYNRLLFFIYFQSIIKIQIGDGPEDSKDSWRPSEARLLIKEQNSKPLGDKSLV